MGQSLIYETEVYHRKLQLFFVLIWTVHSLIHQILTECLRHPSTILNARDTAANKAHKNLCHYKIYAERSDETVNKINKKTARGAKFW